MKKINLYLVVSLMLMGSFIGEASAIGTLYTRTVPALGTSYVNSAVTAVNPIYKFALNKLNTYSGSATVHSTYQTLVGSEYQDAGSELSLNGTNIAAVWRPSAVSGNPLGYTVGTSAICSNTNTSVYNCVLKNIQYRLKLKNKNLISAFTINANFDFSN